MRDSGRLIICQEKLRTVSKPWGSGWVTYTCSHPEKHKGHHQCGKVMWSENCGKENCKCLKAASERANK